MWYDQETGAWKKYRGVEITGHNRLNTIFKNTIKKICGKLC